MSSYTVGSTERFTCSASETETKALLYLMNFREDSDEIHYFIVDFFNDITGMDQYSTRMWDVQSKASNGVSPKQIGRNLVTLYKNFVSDFDFHSYILFMGTPSDTVRIDNQKLTFGIDNIKSDALSRLAAGLKEESMRATYIDHSRVTDDGIQNFLRRVLFVIDDKKPCDYIRAMIKVKAELIPDNDRLTGIFNEIRNKQSSKKNGPSVEGITIALPHEALNYYRHLRSDEIKLLVLSRVINQNPMNQNPTLSFWPILNHIPVENRKECVEDCRINLARALFDKSSVDFFWDIFAEIYSLIKRNPNDSVDQIFTRIDQSLLSQSRTFDTMSLKFFIANVKDGVEL